MRFLLHIQLRMYILHSLYSFACYIELARFWGFLETTDFCQNYTISTFPFSSLSLHAPSPYRIPFTFALLFLLLELMSLLLFYNFGIHAFAYSAATGSCGERSNTKVSLNRVLFLLSFCHSHISINARVFCVVKGASASQLCTKRLTKRFT